MKEIKTIYKLSISMDKRTVYEDILENCEITEKRIKVPEGYNNYSIYNRSLLDDFEAECPYVLSTKPLKEVFDKVKEHYVLLMTREVERQKSLAAPYLANAARYEEIANNYNKLTLDQLAPVRYTKKFNSAIQKN